MKYGFIVLIDEEMLVIVIVINWSVYDKVVSNIQEVKVCKGMVIVVVIEGEKIISEMVDYIIEILDMEELLMLLFFVILLQLFFYYIVVMCGCNVDQL